MYFVENFMKMRILQSHGLHGSRAFQEIYNDFRKTIMKNELPVPRQDWHKISDWDYSLNHFQMNLHGRV